MQVYVNRKEIRFLPDSSRVISRFFFTSDERSLDIIRFVLDMPEREITITLNQVLRDYARRHRNISLLFEKHFKKLAHLFEVLKVNPDELSLSVRVLVGSYFTREYSIESAAFFNPSVVEDPDQSETKSDEKRLIFSFRATGEGHISSIVFRNGVIDKNNNIDFEPVGKMLAEADLITKRVYEKKSFLEKLKEMQERDNRFPPTSVLESLGDSFTYDELKSCVDAQRKLLNLSPSEEMYFDQIIWLASSHYELGFSFDSSISERVIFPIEETERNGIEDARFVKFIDDDGSVTYYATYTAYDGISILQKLIETKNFYQFEVKPIYGTIAKNKGMALFPRKINGKYAMLCRMDGVNNYISFSDNINIWNEAIIIQKPKYSWELVQIGNCGSPLETPEGWLMITHGVGPMREYALGAALLDLEHPEKEIGRLKSPLLMPNNQEREGYVPNVVYSCGSIIHGKDLILPYALSDYTSTYATINLEELLTEIKK